tara:strand:+ start:326 stop:1372 length:1047 start_codon:yes stop_codon:yes gene_type:complete
MDGIPDEILAEILCCVGLREMVFCAQVNKRWYRVLKHVVNQIQLDMRSAAFATLYGPMLCIAPVATVITKGIVLPRSGGVQCSFQGVTNRTIKVWCISGTALSLKMNTGGVLKELTLGAGAGWPAAVRSLQSITGLQRGAACWAVAIATTTGALLCQTQQFRLFFSACVAAGLSIDEVWPVIVNSTVTTKESESPLQLSGCTDVIMQHFGRKPAWGRQTWLGRMIVGAVGALHGLTISRTCIREMLSLYTIATTATGAQHSIFPHAVVEWGSGGLTHEILVVSCDVGQCPPSTHQLAAVVADLRANILHTVVNAVIVPAYSCNVSILRTAISSIHGHCQLQTGLLHAI